MYMEHARLNPAEEKEQMVDIDARIQCERARLLGGYNTLSNAARMRDEQVFYCDNFYRIH